MHFAPTSRKLSFVSFFDLLKNPALSISQWKTLHLSIAYINLYSKHNCWQDLPVICKNIQKIKNKLAASWNLQIDTFVSLERHQVWIPVQVWNQGNDNTTYMDLICWDCQFGYLSVAPGCFLNAFLWPELMHNLSQRSGLDGVGSVI